MNYRGARAGATHPDPFFAEPSLAAETRPGRRTALTFPRAVPEQPVDPGDAGDEAVGFDNSKDRPGIGIDPKYLPIQILPHPEHPFGPCEPGVAAAAGRRDSGEHTACVGIDLLDAILGDLKQVPAVEGGSCMRSDISGAQHPAARRIERVQLLSGGKPDFSAVMRHSMHAPDARYGTVLTNDIGC